MARRNVRVAILGLFLGACGGGGDGGSGSGGMPASPPAVTISGSVASPSGLTSAPPIQSVAPTPPSDLLLPPSSLPANFPAIAQSAQYTFSSSALPAFKAMAVSFNTLDMGAFVQPGIAGPAYPADPTLGQLFGISVLTASGVGIGPLATPGSIDTSFAQPTVTLTTNVGVGSEDAGYALPHSAALNPAGFTYQTFGGWSVVNTATTITDGFFSFGIPTTATIPVTGTALYNGPAEGTFIDATTGSAFDVITLVTVQVDFAARTLTLVTSATSTLSVDAAAGAARSAADSTLTMHANVSYPVSTNTFAGAATTVNGMSGNVTGRFYGPPLAIATVNKALGSPTEIGGTFALLMPGVGTFQASFGAN